MNFIQVGLGMVRNPLTITKKLYDPNKPLVVVKGPVTICQVNDFSLAKDLMLTHQSSLNKPKFYQTPAKLFKVDGVLFANGEEAMKGRKWANENINPKDFIGFEQKVKDLTVQEMHSWPQEMQANLRNAISTLTIKIVWSEMLKLGELPKTFATDMEYMLDRANTWTFPPLGMLTALNPMNYKTPAVIKRIQNALPGSERKNSLSYLIAGYEATASTILWALEELALQKTSTQLDPDDLESLVKETMRLHPAGYLLFKEAKNNFEWQGQTFKKNSMFIVPVIWLQQDERYYEDAKVFKLDRFKNKRPPAEWIPFGMGQRTCLGVGFATLEIKAILQMILEKYEPVFKNGGLSIAVPHISLRTQKNSALTLIRRT